MEGWRGGGAPTLLAARLCCTGCSDVLLLPMACACTRSSWTSRLVTAKDHGSVQINIGHLDESGVYTNSFTTFAVCGAVRKKVHPAWSAGLGLLLVLRVWEHAPWRGPWRWAHHSPSWRSAGRGRGRDNSGLPRSSRPEPWKRSPRPVYSSAGPRPAAGGCTSCEQQPPQSTGAQCHLLLRPKQTHAGTDALLLLPAPPALLQGEADSALDHLWTNKRTEIGQ